MEQRGLAMYKRRTRTGVSGGVRDRRLLSKLCVLLQVLLRVAEGSQGFAADIAADIAKGCRGQSGLA